MDIRETLQFVNQSVRALNAYHLEPAPCRTKLNQNENPYDWPAEIKEELAAFCRERPWNRYPPFVPDELKAALAAYVGARPEGVIAGNGSNEMLLTILVALMDRSRPVILCQPTFTVYGLLVKALGGQTLTVRLRDRDLAFDVPAVCAASAANPGALLVLCSPNNPTGSWLERGDLEQIIKSHRGIVVVDQAYVEFGGCDAAPLIERNPNLVVTRTFSKAFSGAGLRLGYLVGAPELVSEINKAKLPYNLNFFTEYTARVLLRHTDLVKQRVDELRAARDTVEPFLRSLPFDAVFPSAANFILVRTKRKAELVAFLAQRGILLRDVSSYPMLENCLRVSIGSRDENAELCDVLRAFFAKGGKGAQ